MATIRVDRIKDRAAAEAQLDALCPAAWTEILYVVARMWGSWFRDDQDRTIKVSEVLLRRRGDDLFYVVNDFKACQLSERDAEHLSTTPRAALEHFVVRRSAELAEFEAHAKAARRDLDDAAETLEGTNHELA